MKSDWMILSLNYVIAAATSTASSSLFGSSGPAATGSSLFGAAPATGYYL